MVEEKTISIEEKKLVGHVERTAGKMCYVDKVGDVWEITPNRRGRPKKAAAQKTEEQPAETGNNQVSAVN